jgi:hypothetical protein
MTVPTSRQPSEKQQVFLDFQHYFHVIETYGLIYCVTRLEQDATLSGHQKVAGNDLVFSRQPEFLQATRPSAMSCAAEGV